MSSDRKPVSFTIQKDLKDEFDTFCDNRAINKSALIEMIITLFMTDKDFREYLFKGGEQMRTKTIDVWVSEYLERDLESDGCDAIHNSCYGDFNIKAKLIIEIPEKITISESDFYKAVENVNTRNSHKSVYCDVADLKKELGFQMINTKKLDAILFITYVVAITYIFVRYL